MHTKNKGATAKISTRNQQTQFEVDPSPPDGLKARFKAAIKESKTEWRQFWVLMWKHGIVRRRKFIGTPVELMSPCFYFLLLLLTKPFIFPPSPITLNEPIAYRSEVVPFERVLPPQLILYTPVTPLTTLLMSEAGSKMDLEEQLYFPEPSTSGYYGFSKEELGNVNELSKEMCDDLAIVIFQDMNEGIWPMQLNYTIRMKNDLYRSAAEKKATGLLRMYGVMHEPFMRLQWAIDSSFLTLVARNQTTADKEYVSRSSVDLPTVGLSEIPFEDSTPNPMAAMSCTMLRSMCLSSLLLPFVFLLVKLIEERSTGVQELMKQVGVSFDTWKHAHAFNTILTGLCYSVFGTIACKVSSNPMIPHTSALPIFLLFELHFHSIMAFAFVCVYLSKSGENKATLAVIIYILASYPATMLDGKYLHILLRFMTGLLPHVPLNWFWWEVQVFEVEGLPLDYKHMIIGKSHTDYSLNAATAYVCLLTQIVLYYDIASYFNQVCPGKHGTHKPWYYPFRKKEKIAEGALLETEEESLERDPTYFEDKPPARVGIDVDHVTKIFGKKIALSNVTFPVARGEITVLLGHNGAGKTTLMSIITAMMSPTTGKVLINGVDITKERRKVQTMVGLCPQHNLFLPDMTVLEHVRFFAMLKGTSYKESDQSSKELLNQLGLKDKYNSLVHQLSGGMMRRVQLACALSGGSNVLVLDEPTSGMDVETRRQLWNLLLSLRGKRTVLLSTHFMEEADALGDRVAALHGGRLRCFASPMYLKKSIGSGYRLSLTTSGLPKQEITELVTSIIPAATVKETSYNTISFNIPSQDSHKFPQLFTKLEEKRSALEIQSIGVGVSSLEEVFLKLCSDVETKFNQGNIDIETPVPKFTKIKGYRLCLQQIKVLVKRQIWYLLYSKYSFMFIQILIPVLALLLWAIIFGQPDEPEPKSFSAMNLDAYDNQNKRTVVLNVDGGKALNAVHRLRKHYENMNFEEAQSITDTVFRASNNDGEGTASELKKHLVGLELNNTNAKVMFTASVRDAAPVALNLLSNILAAQMLRSTDDGKTISTKSHPLEDSFMPLGDPSVIKYPKTMELSVIWCLMVVAVILSTLVNCVSLPTIERETGVRHIHIMSGCSPAVHWLTTFFTHTLLYTFILVLPATLAFLIDAKSTFNQIDFMGTVFLILLMGSITFLLVCYLATFSFSTGGSGLLLTVLLLVGGIIPGTIVFARLVMGSKPSLWAIPLNVLCYVFPAATTTLAVFKASQVARLNALCNINLALCPEDFVTLYNKQPSSADIGGFDPKKCCAGEGIFCYLCSGLNAPGKELLLLAIQMVVYGTLVVLTQHGIFNGIYDRIFNAKYKKPPQKFNNPVVEAEKTYVENEFQQPPEQLLQGPNAMLVNRLHKNFFNICRKHVNAVKGISFSVKKGECFGLLGVNGAGKSTTFRMISGEEVPTRGNIYTNGQVLKWPRSSTYLQSLAYCPQYMGLDEFLTGHQNMEVVLSLHGLNEQDMKSEAETWIHVVGLERYSNVLVEGYSGGCMRRLATAASLSGGAAVTMLDEPTAGVDVSARRRVWMALRKGLRDKQAVIITSHSMDEMEALCDRIVIMSAGEIGALGSAPALRAAHAAGHALVIKIKASTRDRVQQLKAAVQENFNCTIKDEHKTMLHYHINVTMAYSEIFTKLESLKTDFSDIIEDYSVTETTLEEVFLSFAQPRGDHKSGPPGSEKQKKKEKKEKKSFSESLV